jgi:predicted nuclease of predicted toxin-antitoxin system
MDFLADENLPSPLVAWIRDTGHDVLYAAESQPGAEDMEWLSLAEGAGRVIMTSDKDFGELVFRERLSTHGVVLLRLDGLTITERIARLQATWSIVEANPAGKFIVISKHKVRVRPIVSP